MSHKKVLFLLKKNTTSGGEGQVSKSGLLNSARLTAAAIERNFRAEVKVEVVVDANSIDREVHKYKPKFCILEALWVTPEKMQEVAKKHPKVNFIVRVHSEIPFLANEGIAVEWIKGYNLIENVYISFNEKRTANAFQDLGIHAFYLPNIYSDVNPERSIVKGIFDRIKYYRQVGDGLSYPYQILDVGCFGAIRPLKNQLIQAAAAMIFCEKTDTILNFHINSSRVEQKGDSVLKNIRALFHGTKHNLVEHDWYTHSQFLRVVRKMDLGMQLSFTETFNIITADFVSQRVPMVVSPEINWMPRMTKAEPTDIGSIVDTIDLALSNKRFFKNAALVALDNYNLHALNRWGRVLRGF